MKVGDENVIILYVLLLLLNMGVIILQRIRISQLEEANFEKTKEIIRLLRKED